MDSDEFIRHITRNAQDALDGIPTADSDPGVSSGFTLRPWHRYVAGITVALATAPFAYGAIHSGHHDAHPPHRSVVSGSPDDPTISLLIDKAKVANELVGDAPDIAAAKKHIAALPKGVNFRVTLAEAADAAQASAVAEEFSQSDGSSLTQAVNDIAKVNSPTYVGILRGVAVDAQVDNIINDTSTDTNADAEGLAQTKALPPSSEKQLALTYFDDETATDIASQDFSYQPTSVVAAARADLAKQVSNATTRAIANNKIDVSVAEAALDDSSIYTGDATNAVHTATAIQNSALRAEVDEDVKSDARASQSYVSDSAVSLTLSNALQIGSAEHAFSALQARESTLNTHFTYPGTDAMNGFDNDTQILLDTSDRQAGTMLRQKDHIADLSNDVSFPNLNDPAAVVDLQHAHGSQTIADSYEQVNNDAEDPNTYKQFAEAYVSNGSLQLHFEAKNGLSPETMTQLQAAFERAKPLLEASINAGNLVSVHFVTSDDYNPYYFSSTREIFMVLPTDSSTSVDQLSSGLIHETIHSLARDIDVASSDITGKQIAQINQACRDLRSSVNDQFAYSLQAMPQILSDLQTIAKPQDKKIFTTFATIIKNGTLPQLMTDTVEGDNTVETVLNSCSGIGLGDVTNAVGESISIDDANDRLSYLSNTKQFQALAQIWDDIATYSSVYSKLNESTFTDTQYSEAELLGHSQDNTDELIASITDAAVSYPAKFKQVLAGLDPQELKAAKEAINFSSELIAGRYPSLRPFFTHLMLSMDQVK